MSANKFEAALRAYQTAHDQFLNSPIWGAEAEQTRAALDAARSAYLEAKAQWRAQCLPPSKAGWQTQLATLDSERLTAAQHNTFPKGRW